MRSPGVGLLCIVCLFAASQARAQMDQLPLTSAAGTPPQEVLPSPFRCSNFRHNSDGSWSPLRSVTIRTGDTTAIVAPGVSFATGASFAGVDLAAVLNRQCVPH
jgi:hypothetical protein